MSCTTTPIWPGVCAVHLPTAPSAAICIVRKSVTLILGPDFIAVTDPETSLAEPEGFAGAVCELEPVALLCFPLYGCNVKHCIVAGLMFRSDTLIGSAARSVGGGAGELYEFFEKITL